MSRIRKRFSFLGTVIVALLFSSSTLLAQQHVATIPYEMIGGKMIVEMIVNNRPERFIFDTGASQTVILGSYSDAHSLPIVDSTKVTDVNSNVAVYRRTSIESITTPDRVMGFSKIPALILDGNALDCFDVIGLVGSDLMDYANLICTIDSKNKEVIFTTAEKPVSHSIRYAHNFVGSNHLPVIEGVLNSYPIKILFDTGFGGLFSLKVEDHAMLDSLSAIKPVDTGFGAGSIGLSGESIPSLTHLVEIDDFRIGPAKFKGLRATTSTVPVTLVGMAILKYGDVTIDYSRKRVYFVPHTREPVQPPHSYKGYNLRVKDGELRIGTVWTAFQDLLESGDLITHIDGEPTREFDFCKSILQGIPEITGKEGVKLTIQKRDGSSIELEY